MATCQGLHSTCLAQRQDTELRFNTLLYSTKPHVIRPNRRRRRFTGYTGQQLCCTKPLASSHKVGSCRSETAPARRYAIYMVPSRHSPSLTLTLSSPPPHDSLARLLLSAHHPHRTRRRGRGRCTPAPLLDWKFYPDPHRHPWLHVTQPVLMGPRWD